MPAKSDKKLQIDVEPSPATLVGGTQASTTVIINNSVQAQNGLNASALNLIKWGGQLIEDTTVGDANYTTEINAENTDASGTSYAYVKIIKGSPYPSIRISQADTDAPLGVVDVIIANGSIAIESSAFATITTAELDLIYDDQTGLDSLVGRKSSTGALGKVPLISPFLLMGG
jgi:hypothetical protein